MPLMDHFHAPLAPRRHWESFHVNWAGAMADALNETLLPEGFFAEEHAQIGPSVETEVLVMETEGGSRLVAAIELVSPGSKDRPAQRQAFVVKCASYLCRGISLIVIDIVTTRRANLHNETMQVLGHGGAFALPAEALLYAVAYRPIVRDQREQVEVWPSPLEISRPLPVLPLALNAELALPIDLEATYTAACQRRQLA